MHDQRERIDVAEHESGAAEGGHSALVILVPEADPLVADYRLRYDPSAAQGMPARYGLWTIRPDAGCGGNGSYLVKDNNGQNLSRLLR